MSTTHAIVSVTTAQTALHVSNTPDRGAYSITVQNPVGGQVVYIGGNGVTSSSYGFQLAPGSSVAFDLLAGELLYGIVAATTQNVAILRQGV